MTIEKKIKTERILHKSTSAFLSFLWDFLSTNRLPPRKDKYVYEKATLTASKKYIFWLRGRFEI